MRTFFFYEHFREIENFRENIAKFRLIFAFGEKLLEKHKIFPKFYVYFITFSENFCEAKFRLIFAFLENLKKHFRFNPTWYVPDFICTL